MRHPIARAAQLAWEASEFLPTQEPRPAWDGQYQPYQPDTWDPQGQWTLGLECGRPNDSVRWFNSHQHLACVWTGQLFGTNGAPDVSHLDPWVIPASSSIIDVHFYKKYWTGSQWRHDAARRYYRFSTGQETWFRKNPRFPAATRWASRPPLAVPWRLLPRLQDGPNRQTGPRTKTGIPGAPPVDRRGRWNRPPGEVHRRPGQGERERKFTLMSGGPMRRLIEAGFEFTDLVAVAHDALPPDCQAKGITALEQFAAVYACLDRLDGCKLIEGVINMQIEDYILGKLGRASGAAGKRLAKSYGVLGWTGPATKREALTIPKVNLGC